MTRISKLSTIVALLAVCLGITATSCKKKKDTTNDATKFEGTWTCTNTCSSGGTTNLSFTIGYDVNSLILSGTTVGASGTCAKSVNLTVTVSDSTLSIPPQTFTDNCGKSYSVSGTGKMDTTSIRITEYINGDISSTCVYTGRK